jgi:hypothetical protein
VRGLAKTCKSLDLSGNVFSRVTTSSRAELKKQLPSCALELDTSGKGKAGRAASKAATGGGFGSKRRTAVPTHYAAQDWSMWASSSGHAKHRNAL